MREPPRSASVERRLRPRPAGALNIPRGTIKATVLIETLPAAFEMDEILYELQRSQRRPELRAVGLHLQLHQDPAERSDVRAPRSRAGDDGGAVSEGVCAAPHQDLPSPRRARDGRHGRADSRSRTIRRRTRRRWTRSAPTSSAKCGKGTTAPGSPIPALVSVAKQVFDAGMPGPNQLTRMRDDVTASAAAMVEPPQGTRTEAGLRLNIRVGDPVPRSLAERPGRRAHLQPDGGCGHRRNLPDPDLAMAPPQGDPRRRPAGDRIVRQTGHCRGIRRTFA